MNIAEPQMRDSPQNKSSQIQYFFKKINDLMIDSVLKELPLYNEMMPPFATGRQVADILEKDEHLPGILIMEDGKLHGMISRDMFYERSGKQFGTEIYLGRPISIMLKTIEHKMLILPDSMLISLATQKALSRELKSIYQPIIIENTETGYSLISVLMLFLAQNQLLMEMHNQRLFTVDSGRGLSDRDAILSFIKHVGNQPAFNLGMFIDRHEVRCDNCQKMVNYSVVDIVRSFPQLNRGVVVEEKMGVRTYRLYLRHYCRNREIWEIPLHLDEHLEYRSQRQARAVESYV